MKYVETFGDRRQLAHCAFCGGVTETSDHCPSRVFLDEPYPDNLPVVPACSDCNQGFSADEEYLACLVSCVASGSTDPNSIGRPKIKRILTKKPALRARLERSCRRLPAGMFFSPEIHRLNAIITKLCQGHALYELHEPCPRLPTTIMVKPLITMNPIERLKFESPAMTQATVWPEVGSRAMQRLVIDDGEVYNGWLEVQPQRYRFRASVHDGIDVRIVLQEYLAAVVCWRD